MKSKISIAICFFWILASGCSDEIVERGNTTDSGATTPKNDAGASDVQNAPDMSATADVDVDVEPAGPNPFPNGLTCTTVSLCSTYSADPSRVPFPEKTGGTLVDGMYRAVQGSSVPYGLAISGNKFATVFENMTVSHGDFSIVGDTMLMKAHTFCGPGTENDDPALGFEFVSSFATDGNELITYSGCDSLNPENCASPTRLIRVKTLCDDLDALSCESGDCDCAVFDNTIPPRPEMGCKF